MRQMHATFGFRDTLFSQEKREIFALSNISPDTQKMPEVTPAHVPEVKELGDLRGSAEKRVLQGGKTLDAVKRQSPSFDSCSPETRRQLAGCFNPGRGQPDVLGSGRLIGSILGSQARSDMKPQDGVSKGPLEGKEAQLIAHVTKEDVGKKVDPEVFKNLTQQKVPEQKETDQLLDKMRQELEVFRPRAKVREPVRDKEGNIVMDKNTNKPQMRERDVHGGDKALAILKIIFLAVAYLQALGRELSGETKELPLPRGRGEKKLDADGTDKGQEQHGAKSPDQFDREHRETRTRMGEIDEELRAERIVKESLDGMATYIQRWADTPKYPNPQNDNERAINTRIDEAKERLKRVRTTIAETDERIADLQRQRGELQKKLDGLDRQSGPLEARIRVLNLALKQILNQIPDAQEKVGGFEFAVTEQGIIVVRLKDPQGFLHAFFEDHFPGKTEVSFDELRRALEGVTEGKTNQKSRENKSPEGPRPSPNAGKESPEAKERAARAFRKSKGEEILRNSLLVPVQDEFILKVPYRFSNGYYHFWFNASLGRWLWRNNDKGPHYSTARTPEDSSDEWEQAGIMSARSVISRLRWVEEEATRLSRAELALHDNRELDGEKEIQRFRGRVQKIGMEWQVDTAWFTEIFFRYDDASSQWWWRAEDSTQYYHCSQPPKDSTGKLIADALQIVNTRNQDMYNWRAGRDGELPFVVVPSPRQTENGNKGGDAKYVEKSQSDNKNTPKKGGEDGKTDTRTSGEKGSKEVRPPVGAVVNSAKVPDMSKNEKPKSVSASQDKRIAPEKSKEVDLSKGSVDNQVQGKSAEKPKEVLNMKDQLRFVEQHVQALVQHLVKYKELHDELWKNPDGSTRRRKMVDFVYEDENGKVHELKRDKKGNRVDHKGNVIIDADTDKLEMALFFKRHDVINQLDHLNAQFDLTFRNATASERETLTGSVRVQFKEQMQQSGLADFVGIHVENNRYVLRGPDQFIQSYVDYYNPEDAFKEERLPKLSDKDHERIGSELFWKGVDIDEKTLKEKFKDGTYAGDLVLKKMEYERLPADLKKINGNLTIEADSGVFSLNQIAEVTGNVTIKKSGFFEIPSLKRIGGDFIADGSMITKLPEGLHIDGSLSMKKSSLEGLTRVTVLKDCTVSDCIMLHTIDTVYVGGKVNVDRSSRRMQVINSPGFRV